MKKQSGRIIDSDNSLSIFKVYLYCKETESKNDYKCYKYMYASNMF